MGNVTTLHQRGLVPRLGPRGGAAPAQPIKHAPPPACAGAPRGIVQRVFLPGAPPSGARLAAAGTLWLPAALRRHMETLFKAEFSDVRIRVGPEAPALRAPAVTSGSTVFVAPGQYRGRTRPRVGSSSAPRSRK